MQINQPGDSASQKSQKPRRSAVTTRHQQPKRDEPFDAAELCKKLEALQDELRQKQRRLREKKAGQAKSVLPKHYIPQSAAAEFFRTATPETFTRPQNRAKSSRRRCKTPGGAVKRDRSGVQPNQHVEASVTARQDSTTTPEHPSHANPTPSNQNKHRRQDAGGPDQEEYGSRNPEDRPNWTQVDADPVVPRHGVRDLVTPLLRHMPSRIGAQSISMAAKSEAPILGSSSHHRGKSTFVLPVRHQFPLV